MGKTQNANESLHSVIWHNSPKAKYVGQKSIDISTSIAVTTFNDGEMALAAVLSSMSIPSSHSTLLHLTRRDRARNQNRERAILEILKRRRRQLTSRKQRRNLHANGGRSLVRSQLISLACLVQRQIIQNLAVKNPTPHAIFAIFAFVQ